MKNWQGIKRKGVNEMGENDSGEIQENSEVVVDNDNMSSREISNSDIEYELDKRIVEVKKEIWN